jgi:GMP synthase (glutamine-hydrolysing)
LEVFKTLTQKKGQFCHLIARRVRELEVSCEILPFDTKISDLVKLSPVGIILSGGPSSVYEKDAPHPDPEIFNLNIPILGKFTFIL